MWKSHGDFLGFFGLVQISRGGVRPERDYTCIELPSSEKETYTMKMTSAVVRWVPVVFTDSSWY
jgi:hypothetical protein